MTPEIGEGGRFGRFGGQYVPEILVEPLRQLEAEYLRLKDDESFQNALRYYLSNYAGRPTPIYYAENLTRRCGGARIYLKREDLLHGGAHKINNTLGQGLLARRMGKRRVIAETGAGQHGVATSMACAALGLKAEIYMGSDDMRRQRLNVFRMKLLGAEVIEVKSGSRTLKDAINEAFRDWIANLQDTYYLLGSAVGPHPYPMIVRDFQSVIGHEIRQQMERSYGKPDALVACVGGGSNAIGTFYPFLDDDVQLYGVEAGGRSGPAGKHAASLSLGSEGVFHGMATYVLQDEHGQILDTDSIAAGLDYPGVGPEHSYLKSTARVHYTYVNDTEALEAFSTLSKEEGILPALEAAHGLAFVMKKAAEMGRDQRIVLTLSGRGDKDVEVVADRLGML